MTPTLAEVLQSNGIPTIIAGSKPVALLHDRNGRKETAAAKKSVTLFEGKTIPRSLRETLVKVNDDKAFPTPVTYPNSGQDKWTTKSLVKHLWKDGVPKYTLLWLSDPDKSQHETGVGSPTALAGIEASDNNLAEVINTLKSKGVWDKTDLMVVSDHGFSTIFKGPEIGPILQRQNFAATNKVENPEPGDVMVVGLGGSVLLYVLDKDVSVIRRLVDFLQTADFTGVIFSRLPFEGTFPLESVGYSMTNNAPDLLVSLRWNADVNSHGAPGMMTSTGGTVGKGSHASLSRFDMNNTLVAAGPSFKKGLINEVPSGNIDLAPTILWLLGVRTPPTMDGRILNEALKNPAGPEIKPETNIIEATRDIGLFRWKQYLKFSKVGSTTYFDEGNGQVSRK
jgi:predicted AlkP superfamily pyrophosphatase or phosphodiesterase